MLTTILLYYMLGAMVTLVFLFEYKDSKGLENFFNYVQKQYNKKAEEKQAEIVPARSTRSIVVVGVLVWWIVPLTVYVANKEVEDNE